MNAFLNRGLTFLTKVNFLMKIFVCTVEPRYKDPDIPDIAVKPWPLRSCCSTLPSELCGRPIHWRPAGLLRSSTREMNQT